MCRKKCKYNGDSKAQTFLCGIARIAIVEHFSAEKSRPETVSLEQIETHGELSVVDTVSQSPQLALQRKQTSRIVGTEVDKLPKKARQAVKLVYFEGLKPADAAQKAGCSIKTFRDRLKYGKKLLKLEFEKNLKNLDF